MERILSLIIKGENIRMLVLLVFGFCGLVLLKTSLEKRIDALDRRIDGVEHSLSRQIDDLRHNDLAAIHRRIDDVESSLSRRIDDLKNNDFAHLNRTIEALTYALEKNGSLKKEDRAFIDSRLAR